MSENAKSSRLTVNYQNDVPAPAVLEPLLAFTAARHDHLCPRQVLGVRLGLCGLRLLGLVAAGYEPRFANHGKRLLTFVETDGCGADGIAVATDCAVGRRTLRVVDYGKVAATLIDTHTGQAIRVAPSQASRSLAPQYAPEAPSRWHAYLEAYRLIPDSLLVKVESVVLKQSPAVILSNPEARAICAHCSEEIINQRELIYDKQVLCQSCAGHSYYRHKRLT